MRRRFVAVSVLALLALGSAPAVSSATFIPGPAGKVVWTSGRANTDVTEPASGNDNSARLWVADYPFGTPVQVTTGTVGIQHRHPNWSPDHSRIVYASGQPFSPTGSYELRIKDLRNGSDTQFAPTAELQDRPSWSPDGTEIAYGSQGDLWVKGVAAGSQAVKVTDDAENIEERPVWSPDGNTLYYNRGKPPLNPGNRDIYKISPISVSAAEVPITSTAANDWQPALSPDGTELCFLRGPMGAEADIFLVNVNGGLPTPFVEFAEGNINCVWSPDGETILYTRGVFSAGNLRAADSFTASPVSLPSSWSVSGMGNEHFDGNADWATNFSPECNPVNTAIDVNQFTTIQLSCTDPDSGAGASPPTPEPIEENDLEIVSPPKSGTIGGITDDEKVIYTPNKDFRGTDSFTYTGSDSVSEADPTTVTIQVGQELAGGRDGTPPRITNIRVSAKRWRLGNQLAKISASPVGTTISFRLSEAAQATLTFQRRKRTRGGKTKFVNAGRVVRQAKAGKNRVRFQGPLTRTKKLSPGTYRVVVAARDAAGNRSKRNGPTFTIVKK
jgi:hypothetical protein